MNYNSADETPDEKRVEYNNDSVPTIESWVTLNNREYFFNFKSVDNIPSGLYKMIFNESHGFGLSKSEYRSEDFYQLPSLPHKKIIADLQNFWENKDKFLKYNLTPKRGIILYGDSGCGKTTLTFLLVEEIKKRDGFAIYFDVPENWVEITQLIRRVEKDRPILCIIEDIDKIIEKFGEEVFLNFLDGLNSIDNVVYIATTNNLDMIPDRIKDRPSRFDIKYKIKKPTEEDRRVYFNYRLSEEDKDKYDINKLVTDTEGFTMAHIRELFISLYILDNPYNKVLKRLKNSKITDTSSIGFTGMRNNNEDEDED